MQGNGSGSFFLMALLGCCLLLMAMLKTAEASSAHDGAYRRPLHHQSRKPLRAAEPGEHRLIRFIKRPVATALGREDHVVLRGREGRHLFHYASHSTYLWCVPYARRLSHIDLIGDAFLWWAEASGRYARGSRPEPGAILAFRAIRGMPLGHVAVVSRVIDNRDILVDQANWVHNRITRNIRVVDISPTNSWTKVRVEKSDGKLGDPYPTYGFIYDHAPNDMVIASRGNGSEVAEAPTPQAISMAAPHRNLQ